MTKPEPKKISNGVSQNLGHDILEKIKQSHIKPKPKWEFLLKEYVMWAMFITAILVGSLAIAVSIFTIRHDNWEYYADHAGLVGTILINLPYFWLIILVAFLALAFYNIKHTDKGYKYNTLAVLGASIVVSIMIGSASYSVGLGEELEDIFYRRVGIYKQLMEQRARMLFSPALNTVPGVVIDVDPDKIKIQDFNGRLWLINTTTTQFDVGDRIILVGKNFSGEEFEIEILKPWFKPHHRLIEFRFLVPPPPAIN